jgi:hypothetical protein
MRGTGEYNRGTRRGKPWHLTLSLTLSVMNLPTVTVTLNLSLRLLADALGNAVEGGSRYWAAVREFTLDGEGFLDCDSVADGRARWQIEDMETGRIHTLDRVALFEGVRILGEKYPWHLGALLDRKRSDSFTGDALLQCALFGGIIYG